MSKFSGGVVELNRNDGASIRVIRLSGLTLIIAALTCQSAFGQAVSQINGTAKDSSGAVVPGVEITATQTDTGLKRMTATDANGDYVLPNLPIGTRSYRSPSVSAK
jgi:hypothetical protein